MRKLLLLNYVSYHIYITVVYDSTRRYLNDFMLMPRMDQAGRLHSELVAVAFVGRESAVAAVVQPLASFQVEPSFVDASEVVEAFLAAGKIQIKSLNNQCHEL